MVFFSFIVFAACCSWTYGGYAAFTALLARLFPCPPSREYEPGVSLIVPSYNEEKVISRRLDNLCSLDYPREKLQIIVVDSGSTDGTRDAVKAFASRGVLLSEQPERQGKGAALAFALPSCRHEIVVVTDANAYFERDTVREIVRPFADAHVGGVTGHFALKSAGSNAVSSGSSFFREYENSLRRNESRIDSCVSLFGELCACRRQLFSVDTLNLTEDFESSVTIREKGFRLAYTDAARVHEVAPSSERDLFIQRKRVIIGTLQTLLGHRAMLFNPRYGLYGMLILPGHKLFPVLSPFFLFGFLVCSLLLFPFFVLLAAGVFVFYGVFQRDLFRMARYIILVNGACAVAWCDFLSGRYSVKWQKMESTRV